MRELLIRNRALDCSNAVNQHHNALVLQIRADTHAGLPRLQRVTATFMLHLADADEDLTDAWILHVLDHSTGIPIIDPGHMAKVGQVARDAPSNFIPRTCRGDTQ